MGVIKPGYHLAAGKDLPEMRDRLKGHGKKKNIEAELNLTAMIDMFSVIIIFLVQTYTASGDFFMVAENIKLPAAQYAKSLKRNPIVTVTEKSVILEGAPVGENTNLEEKIEDTDWSLPLLKERLTAYKQFFESIHQGVKFPGEIIIQADKDLDFIYIKRAMYTLAGMGFTSIDLAVAGESRGDSPRSGVDDSGTPIPLKETETN